MKGTKCHRKNITHEYWRAYGQEILSEVTQETRHVLLSFQFLSLCFVCILINDSLIDSIVCFFFLSHIQSHQLQIHKWWRDQLTDSERVFYSILTINLLVFIGWRIPTLAGQMNKYFTLRPLVGGECIFCCFHCMTSLSCFFYFFFPLMRRSEWVKQKHLLLCLVQVVVTFARLLVLILDVHLYFCYFTRLLCLLVPLCLPMVLSTFSHYSLFHLGVNMYAFHSFSRAIGDAMDSGQFTALYLTSGVTASLASLSYKVAVGSTVASLGASGAILGVVSFVCTAMPNSQLLLFFIPMSAAHAIKAIMAFDTVGLFMKWSILDHAAHLGGTLYGQWVFTLLLTLLPPLCTSFIITHLSIHSSNYFFSLLSQAFL